MHCLEFSVQCQITNHTKHPNLQVFSFKYEKRFRVFNLVVIFYLSIVFRSQFPFLSRFRRQHLYQHCLLNLDKKVKSQSSGSSSLFLIYSRISNLYQLVFRVVPFLGNKTYFSKVQLILFALFILIARGLFLLRFRAGILNLCVTEKGSLRPFQGVNEVKTVFISV